MTDTIKFAHIFPTDYLTRFKSTILGAPVSMVLGDLVKRVPDYRDFYHDNKPDDPDNHVRIMDNSAFELVNRFDADKPKFYTDPDELIELGKEVHADCLILPDIPFAPAKSTIEKSLAAVDKFKEAGFMTMFVPQSEPSNWNEYIKCILWALMRPEFDLIGISILGAPNACGVLDHPHSRSLVRTRVVKEVVDSIGGQWEEFIEPDHLINRFHFLGMLDGPGEIGLIQGYLSADDYGYQRMVHSWDSSIAFAYGASCGVFEPGMPMMTTRVKEKIDSAWLDGFDSYYNKPSPLATQTISRINKNIDIIDKMVQLR